MGFFGALFLLACGGAYAHKEITETIDNNKSREEARRSGYKYYYAIDGERAVDTNHKVLRLPDGIKDMETGQWLFDKRKQDSLERKQLSDLDEISKKEAVIKNKYTYFCKLHESDPRRYGHGITGQQSYQRLVKNDMPVERVLLKTFKYYDEKHQTKLSKRYYEAKELHFGFYVSMDAASEIEKEVFEKYKEWNMKYIMTNYCKNYPINKVKVIYQYCKKYDIPMGNWKEIEDMMLEEYPLGWRKVPQCEEWEFKKFLSGLIG